MPYAPPSAPSASPPSTPYAPYAPYGMAAGSSRGYAAPSTADKWVSNNGSKAVTGAGIVAVIAFFILPYVNLGFLGSLTGAQTANAISNMQSLASEFSAYSGSQSNVPPFDLGLLVWAEVALAALVAGIAGWQWYKSERDSLRVSRGAMVLVLLFSLLDAGFLMYQVVGLQSYGFASALGIGFWVLLLSMMTALIGSIAQMRAR